MTSIALIKKSLKKIPIAKNFGKRNLSKYG